MMNFKPAVGQIVYLLNINNNASQGAKQELTPCKVVRSGHKYFTVARDGWSNSVISIRIDNWIENSGDYAAGWKAYPNEQAWLNEKEKAEIFQFIQRQHVNSDEFTLIELLQMKAAYDRILAARTQESQ